MAGGEPRLGTTATYMRHYDHVTTHLSTEIDRLHDRINDEYRVFSAGSVRKWSKFGLADIVKTNTYVTDYEEFAKHGDMRLRYFGPALPTSTTVEVRRLAGLDFMIEIEAIAFVDNWVCPPPRKRGEGESRCK